MRRLAAVGAAVGGLVVVRNRLLRWGASDDEARAALPGDDVVADAHLQATRAITVRRPPAAVWPWVAQMGQGRGGLYSYDALENVVGCDMHSADRVVAEWQHVRAGDEFRLHPDVVLRVAAVEPGRALVVRGDVPMGDTAAPYDFSWAFVLAERDDGGTQLLVRERYRYLRAWAPLLVEPVSVVSFVMTEKMLRGIRDRAEAASRPSPGPGPPTPPG